MSGFLLEVRSLIPERPKAPSPESITTGLTWIFPERDQTRSGFCSSISRIFQSRRHLLSSSPGQLHLRRHRKSRTGAICRRHSCRKAGHRFRLVLVHPADKIIGHAIWSVPCILLAVIGHRVRGYGFLARDLDVVSNLVASEQIAQFLIAKCLDHQTSRDKDGHRIPTVTGQPPTPCTPPARRECG